MTPLPQDKSVPIRGASRALQVTKLLTVGDGETASAPRRKSLQRRQASLGDFSLATEVTIYRKHLPGCRLGRNIPVSKSKSIQLSYLGLRKLFSTAIDFSFSLKTGAGGFSMGPNIALRAVVDRYTSPTFRAMELAQESIYDLQKEDLDQFIEVVIRRIAQLYDLKRSSPRDTDITGNSILHHWADVSYQCISLQEVG